MLLGVDLKEKILSKKYYIFLALIVQAEAVLMLFWATQKNNFFIDELYSMGYAHYFTDRTPLFSYINDTDIWQNSTWIAAADVKKLLTVSAENSIFAGPVFPGSNYNLKVFLLGKNYMGLLNIVNSILCPGVISMRGGILFNILLLIITLLLLAGFVKKLTGDEELSLLSVIIYGTSGIAINMTEYVRFYNFTILLLLTAIYLHYLMWDSNKVIKNIIFEFISFGLIVFSYNNTELSLVVGGLLIAGFALGLLIRKQFFKFAYYFLPAFVGGCAYLLLFTKIPKLIFHPELYTSKGGTWSWVASNFTSVSLENIMEEAQNLHDILVQYFWGSKVILINYAVIITLLVIYAIIKKSKNAGNESNEINQSNESKQGDNAKASGFSWVLLLIFAGYSLFATLIGLSKAVRYYSFVFIILCMLLMIVLSRLIKFNPYSKYIKLLLLVLALGGGVLTSVNHDIEYLYLDEKETMDILSEYENADIVMESQYNDQAARHAIYDCVVHAGENARICPVTYEECNIDFSDCTDTLLIWTHTGMNVANCDIFIENGYQVEKLCSTYTSDIFIAQR